MEKQLHVWALKRTFCTTVIASKFMHDNLNTSVKKMVDIGNMVPMYDVTQLILDPSLLFTSETIIDKIELHSRELISTLHKLRTKILLEKDRQQGLASSVFNHFRGSSSKQQRLRIQNSKKNQQKHSTSN